MANKYMHKDNHLPEGHEFPYNEKKPFHVPNSPSGKVSREDVEADYRYQRDNLGGGTAEGSEEQAVHGRK